MASFPQDFEFLKTVFDDQLVSQNFVNTSATPQDSPSQPPTFEVRQMLDIGFIKDKAWSDGHKETFVNGLFFFGLQSYLLEMSEDLQARLYVFTVHLNKSFG
jgi:hypothetical protein